MASTDEYLIWEVVTSSGFIHDAFVGQYVPISIAVGDTIYEPNSNINAIVTGIVYVLNQDASIILSLKLSS